MSSLESGEATLYRKDSAAMQGVGPRKGSVVGKSTRREPGTAAVPTVLSYACVMVSYNTGEVLFDAIASVLGQSAAPVELVLVDNGNPAHVQTRLDELAATTDALQVVRGQGNVGFASACNLGASLCSAPGLLFLNPDCVLPEEGLHRLLAEFAQLPPESLLAPLVVNEDFTEQRGSRRSVLTPWRAVVEWLGLYRLAPSHPYFLRFNRTNEPLPEETHKVDVTSGAAMLLERSLFDDLGGFDEGYFLHVEDIDLCVSLLKRGGSAYVAPSVQVIHQGASSASSPLRVEWHKARGFCRYFNKQFSGVYPPGFVPVVNLLVWLRLLLRAPVLLFRARFASGAASPARSDSGS